MERIGLYGGSFDPVHLGHLLVAAAAIEEFQLDRLFVIPTAQSPFKPGTTPTPGDLRLRMLRLAFAGMNQVEVDAQEILRGGISYSIDTAVTFAQRHPAARLCWLIGADHVAALPSWRDSQRLAEMVEFIVIPRPGITPVAPPPPFRTYVLRGFPLALSSSEVRARTQRGQSIRDLVPAPVVEVIGEANLYKPPPPNGGAR